MKRCYLKKTLLPLLLIIFIITLSDHPSINSTTFICGDMDNSNTPFNISDITYFVNWLFLNGAPPLPLETADCDGDGSLTISDLTCFIDYLFRNGSAPACPVYIHDDIIGSCLGNTWVADSGNTAPSLATSSGCLTSMPMDTFEYMYAEFIGNNLHIYHNNAFYNCCLEYQVAFELIPQSDGLHIIATEQDFGPPCDCLCFFNLESVVNDLDISQESTFYITLIGLEGNIVGVDTVKMGPYGYMYCEVENNNINIYHNNALLNCCPDFFMDYEINGNQITAIERDTLYACHCLCNYNLKSTLFYMPPGGYIVTLIGGSFTPYDGKVIGVDTVTIGVIGGPCSYNEFSGTAIITSVSPAPPESYSCNNGVVVEYDFIPDDPNAPNNYSFPNWSDSSRNLKVGGGLNPSASWALSQGLTVGSLHPCKRMEIYEGTCTPVIFELLDVDYISYVDDCFD